MSYFGIVISDNDETPTGRASTALRAQLPPLFPEHVFEFLDPRRLKAEGVTLQGGAQFKVLGAEIRSMDGNLLDDGASFELVQAIQAAVDKIVAAAKGRSLN